MREFLKWVISYWEMKRVVIALPDFMYRIEFYRGRINAVKIEDYKPSSRDLYQVWYDEEITPPSSAGK